MRPQSVTHPKSKAHACPSAARGMSTHFNPGPQRSPRKGSHDTLPVPQASPFCASLRHTPASHSRERRQGALSEHSFPSPTPCTQFPSFVHDSPGAQPESCIPRLTPGTSIGSASAASVSRTFVHRRLGPMQKPQPPHIEEKQVSGHCALYLQRTSFMGLSAGRSRPSGAQAAGCAPDKNSGQPIAGTASAHAEVGAALTGAVRQSSAMRARQVAWSPKDRKTIAGAHTSSRAQ